MASLEMIGHHREPKQHEDDIGEGRPFMRSDGADPVHPRCPAEDRELVEDSCKQP
jgi:hypothetical protein